MKKILLFHALLACIATQAQTITVRDNSTREVIPNVIISDKNKTTVSTDISGKADLGSLDKSGAIEFFHTSYQAFTANNASAMQDGAEVTLTSKIVILDELILSANRYKEHKIDVPYSVHVLNQKDIEFGNQPTNADVMQNTGAVFVQKSQLGGGSPVLRGFEANKVLIVVDGIRMNNAIYRAGHLQDIISLDANMLERTEVLFGPSSTVYGSDALGGVMHFYTKNAQFSAGDKMLLKLNAMTRYASVNNEATAHVDFNLGFKNFASLTNITYSQFGDLRSGTTQLAGSPNSWDRNYYAGRFGTRDSMVKNSDNNLQVGSGYSQLDFMQRFSIRSGEHNTHNINLQYSQSGNINRYDRLTEMRNGLPSFAEWYYGPQKRLLAAYTYNNSSKTAVSDNIRMIAAYQKIDQDRISRNFRSNNKTYQEEDVTVLSLNADVFRLIREAHELRYGLELTSNAVTSVARTENIVTNSVSAAKTRYGDDGNSMSTAAIYVSHTWEVNKNFVISDGLRFSANSLESHFKDTTFYKFPYNTASQNNSALTGNLGFTWKEDDNYKVSALVNTGFRTPNVDDMSKLFESAVVVIVPNPEIKPEYATNFELGLNKVFDKKYKLDFTAFYTLLENALVLADFKYNGRDSAMFNNVLRKVQAVQNKDRAYIYGFSAGVQFDFSPKVSFRSIINYTYGRYADVQRDTVVPLDHIPPVFGQTSLLIREKNMDGEFFVRYNGKKNPSEYSPSGEDNKQYSANTATGYMPGWFTLNLRIGYTVMKNFRVTAACENITDNRYRVFSSGINAPGRNFIVSLRYKF